jgi:proteasome lid subunit RPN8/RPN11
MFDMFKIKRKVLQAIQKAAKNTYPNEFFAYLAGEKKTKTAIELIIPPQEQGDCFVCVREDLMPLGLPLLGSVHSHPSPCAIPSKEDLVAFSKKGLFHIIISYPFRQNDLAIYTDTGKKTRVKVIE